LLISVRKTNYIHALQAIQPNLKANFHERNDHKTENKEGGGIAVFLKNNLPYRVRHDLCFSDDVLGKFDGIFIELITEMGKKNSVLCVIYRTPRYNSISEITTHLAEKIDIIQSENKNIIITGDLNIDLLKYHTNHDTTDFLDQLLLKNIIPKVTVPTRITSHSATLLDHIFTNIVSEKCIAGTLITDISDHFSNFIFIKSLSLKSTLPQTVTYRVMSNQAIDNLNRSLSDHDWTDLYNSTDVNTAYEIFSDQFSQLVNTHLPIKTAKFNSLKHKREPWMTKGILTSLKTKEKLYIQMVKCKGNANYAHRQEIYKQYNFIYKKCIKAAKALHWKITFQETKSNMKKTWENINTILNKKSNKHSFPQVFKDENNEYKTPAEIANGFNKYFTNIGPSLAAKIPPKQKTAAQLLPATSIPNSMFLTPATPNEILNIVNHMKPKTSSGQDNLSPKLIKKCSLNISIPLAHIANLSIATGTFPQKMKIAKVITVYKKDNPTLFENYRPISLLPTFSKILERLVYNRLYQFLNSHNLLTSAQYGFRKGLSTEYAILELQDRIVKNMANKDWCIGIFLDLSKAFDTLDHNILLTKLKHVGICGIALNWFNSYLSDRQQYTIYQNSPSKLLRLNYGVPQGSILGPLLFLIYVNDIVANLNYSQAILYADDTNLIISDKSLSKLVENTNSELSNIETWFAVNKLSLNISKTTYIIFHAPQKTIPPDVLHIRIGPTNIQQTAHIKFLGSYIDEHLNWKKHLTCKANQIVKTTAILSRIKHSIPTEVLKTIYNALILPHISYAIVAWGNINNREMNRLKTLQKKAVRIIHNTKYNSHTNPLFRKSGMLKIQDLYITECFKLFLKNRKKTLPQYLENQLLPNFEFHNYNTRQVTHIHNLPIRTKLEEQQINTKISTVLNHLPDSIKHSPTSSTVTLKDHLLSQYNITCNITGCHTCRHQSSHVIS